MERETDPAIATPLKPKEAAALLNVGTSTIVRMVGLEWVEYQGRGRRPIRRITRESVERMLKRRQGR